MNECLKVTVCNVEIGKCIFTTCEHFFFPPPPPITLVVNYFISFSFTRLQKQKTPEKKSVTSLLSFIFCFFVYFFY